MIAAGKQPFTSPEEELRHLTQTFEANERLFPDLMEPYSARLADVVPNDERTAIMRAGLRETIRRRFPMRGKK